MTYVERAIDFIKGLLARVGLHESSVLAGAVLFVVTFFGSIALTGAVLVRLPCDFLTNDAAMSRRPQHLRARVLRFLRHATGVLLILIGIVLSIPGVPGQGVLTIIAGLFVSEIPGTNRLLRRILRRPGVLATVNKLRARYKHPPLLAPDSP